MDVAEKVRELIVNLLQERAVELVEISYRRGQGGMVLRLLVDKEGGITLGECAYLNEEIGKILDKEDIIHERYILEVSSPGLDRPLKTKRDFERVLGKKVHIHTFVPIMDRRDYEGAVNFVDGDKVIIDNIEIQLDNIAKAKLKIEF